MKKKTQDRRKRLFQLAFLGIILLLLLTKSIASGCLSSDHDEQPVARDSVEIFLDRSLAKMPDMRSVTGEARPIRGVTSYEQAFPDMNDVQLVSAECNGIPPQEQRSDLEPFYSSKLVRIDSCPYYSVDNLTSSVPYLVPKAQKLLALVGRNFIDSLLWKHLPPTQVIVTSVLRTKADVKRLQSTNVNSTANSCHFYGTTFDLSYTRYRQMQTAGGKTLRLVRDDTLKWVLSEVLRDLRAAGACHVKHEIKQGCFHITVK